MGEKSSKRDDVKKGEKEVVEKGFSPNLKFGAWQGVPTCFKIFTKIGSYFE